MESDMLPWGLAYIDVRVNEHVFNFDGDLRKVDFLKISPDVVEKLPISGELPCTRLEIRVTEIDAQFFLRG